MSRQPLVTRRRLKARRRRKERQRYREAVGAYDAEELASASSALIPQIAIPSKTKARKAARQERESEERTLKRADHKLSWMDRVFGTGKGPVRLRMKWMDKLFGG